MNGKSTESRNGGAASVGGDLIQVALWAVDMHAVCVYACVLCGDVLCVLWMCVCSGVNIHTMCVLRVRAVSAAYVCVRSGVCIMRVRCTCVLWYADTYDVRSVCVLCVCTSAVCGVSPRPARVMSMYSVRQGAQN